MINSAGTAGSGSYLTTAGTLDAHGRATKTPIGLVNNGVHLNPNGDNQPTIFTSETESCVAFRFDVGKKLGIANLALLSFFFLRWGYPLPQV